MRNLFGNLKLTILTALSILYMAISLPAAVPGRVTANGTQFAVCGSTRIWMSGANTPWDNWNDFGGTYDGTFWDTHFQALYAAGVNSTRIWITCSGEVGITISAAGVVSGATAAHWANLDDMFAKAQARGIYIMATLISFDHFKNTYTTYNSWRNWINSDSNIDSYVNNYITPFLTRYGNNTALWSIDLCNEPEWASNTENTGEPAVYGAINWTRLQTYFAKAAVAIHKWNNTNGSGPMVTTGMGFIKYNTDARPLGGENKISDARLSALISVAADKPLARMDFWSTHYYPWQNSSGGIIFTYSPASFGLTNDRPSVVGECPNKYGSTNGLTNVAGYLRTDYTNGWNNGWQGFFPWTSNGAGSGDFGDLANELSGASGQMLTQIPTLVRPVCAAGTPTRTQTRTPVYSPTITPTHTAVPPYDIIYDGDTAGHQLSDGTVTNGGAGTMTEAAGGKTGEGMRLTYVSPAWWQELLWNLTVNKNIGANNYFAFDVRAESGTVSAFQMRINWTVTVDTASYIVEGGVIDTTWKTVRIPVSALIEAGQTAIDFIQFINASNNNYTLMIDNIRLEGSAPTATRTATRTPTVAVPSATFTRTRTNTPVNTSTYTRTGTNTPVNTVTYTATRTNTALNTATYTHTRTNTAVNTFTYTRTVTNTSVNTPTYTRTRTNSPSPSASASPSGTPVNTATYTRTRTSTAVNTPTNTAVNTSTFTRTISPTMTVTRTMTPTHTYTVSSTESRVSSPTPTATRTNSPTMTITSNLSPTFTRTNTPVNTSTNTAVNTSTYTRTFSPTMTITITSTPFFTFTRTRTPTMTITSNLSPTFTFTRTSTPVNTSTNTAVNTSTFTRTNTPVNTFTSTAVNTLTFTRTATITATWTPGFGTITVSPTVTRTHTALPSPTFTGTASNTAVNTPTRTSTNTSVAPTFTRTSTATIPVPTLSATASMSPSFTNTMTWTSSVVPTSTSSVVWSATFTATATNIVASATYSRTVTNTIIQSPTATPSITTSPTGTPPTSTNTPTVTETAAPSNTSTFTASPTMSATASVSPMNTYTITPTITITNTPVLTFTQTNSPTMTITITNTPALTFTRTVSPTMTITSNLSPSFTATLISSPTRTSTVVPPTATVTGSQTPIPLSPTPTVTMTITITNTPALTFTRTSSPTITITSNLSPTFTATYTPTTAWSDKLEITEVVPFPQPYTPASGNLNIRILITKPATDLKVRIYTASFRKVLELDGGSANTREAVISIPQYKLSRLSAGTYYAVVTGRSGSEKAVSAPQILVIIK